MSTASEYVTDTGRTFARKPGVERKLPREVRAYLYQLHLTILETKAEIRKVMLEHGFKDSNPRTYQMRRIIEERGE